MTKPIDYLLLDKYDFKKKNKRMMEWSVKKLKVWLYLCLFAYWPTNGGWSSIQAQLIKWMGFDEVYPFDSGKKGCQGYIAISHKNRYCNIVFRGTDQIRDWLKNAKVKTISFDYFRDIIKKSLGDAFLINYNSAGQGHKGYMEGVESVFDDIIRIVKPYIIVSNYQFDVGGHSKGGGEEKIFTSLMQRIGFSARQTFTAGSPGALDDVSVKIYEKSNGQRIRLINPGDPVSYLLSGPLYDRTSERLVLLGRGAKFTKYNAKEFFTNLLRRSISKMKGGKIFGWGVDKHYLPSYLNRLDKIYKKKMNLDI